MSHNHCRDHRDRIIRYLHSSPEWTPRLRAQFWTLSLNEIAKTRPARRSEFWKDKKTSCRTRVSQRTLTWETAGYIRSGPKVSIISSTISSYLVVRESSPRPRRRAHSKKNSLRCRAKRWTVKWPLSLKTSLKLVADLFRISEWLLRVSIRYGALVFESKSLVPSTIIAATSCVIANGSYRSELPHFIAAEKRET